VNPSTERIFGWEQDALIGKNVQVLMGEDDKKHHNDYLRHYLESGEAHILGVGREAVGRRKDGTAFPIDLSVSEAKVDEGQFFVGVIRDITERKAVEAELQAAKATAEEAATHDPLTGLWNHNRILEILMEEMARSDRQGSTVSLIMVDLDHFKMVNDGHGHVVGDEVLREIAERLERAVRSYDSVGRFGGEEFMVVLPGTIPADAEHAAERIRQEIGKTPIYTSAGSLEVTASLGVVTRHGELVNDATALLVAADTALYESKESGRNRVTIASLAPQEGPPEGAPPEASAEAEPDLSDQTASTAP
jgi:diguanylate cyclase (GGDEF)-like protein/PAS domain S-box-containing protein